jgi:hypothetical protein
MLFLSMSGLLLGMLVILAVESLKISGSSAFYPQVLIGASILLLAWSSWRSWQARSLALADPELASLHTGTASIRLRFALFCVIWLVYPLLMPWAGFTASTVAVLYGSALLFGTKHPWLALVGILCFSIVFAILLKSVIYVPVPEAWPDRWINNLMYRL